MATPSTYRGLMLLFFAQNREVVLRRPPRWGLQRRMFDYTHRSPFDGPVWDRPDFERRVAAIKSAAAGS